MVQFYPLLTSMSAIGCLLQLTEAGGVPGSHQAQGLSEPAEKEKAEGRGRWGDWWGLCWEKLIAVLITLSRCSAWRVRLLFEKYSFVNLT